MLVGAEGKKLRCSASSPIGATVSVFLSWCESTVPDNYAQGPLHTTVLISHFFTLLVASIRGRQQIQLKHQNLVNNYDHLISPAILFMLPAEWKTAVVHQTNS